MFFYEHSHSLQTNKLLDILTPENQLLTYTEDEVREALEGRDLPVDILTVKTLLFSFFLARQRPSSKIPSLIPLQLLCAQMANTSAQEALGMYTHLPRSLQI